jgi:hypothetical protein
VKSCVKSGVKSGVKSCVNNFVFVCDSCPGHDRVLVLNVGAGGEMCVVCSTTVAVVAILIWTSTLQFMDIPFENCGRYIGVIQSMSVILHNLGHIFPDCRGS